MYSYFKDEKARNNLFYGVSKPFERTKHVLNLKDRNLKRWMDLSEKPSTEIIVENKKPGRPSKFDTFDKDLVGRSIGKMMVDKQYVTLRTLRSFFKTNHDLHISKATLW